MHNFRGTKGIYKGPYIFLEIKRSFIREGGIWICLVIYSSTSSGSPNPAKEKNKQD